jgi:hypothetical protein
MGIQKTYELIIETGTKEKKLRSPEKRLPP